MGTGGVAFLIIGGAVALALGIWLGLPGDSRAAEEESQQAIREGKGGRTSKRVKKQFVAVDWLFRKSKESQVRKSRQPERRPFKLASSDDKSDRLRDPS